jgi:hypothetical protein
VLASLTFEFPYFKDTWLLTLREEHRLSVFQNRVLGKILGSRKNEVTRKRRLLCSVLLTKCHMGAQIKKTEKGGACSTHGGEKRYIQGFGGET